MALAPHAGVGPFDACESVRVRFPTLSGRALHDQSFKDYVVSRNAHLDYFSNKRSGKKLLTRHPVNSRVQQSVVDTYVESIQKHGVADGVRGACWGSTWP